MNKIMKKIGNKNSFFQVFHHNSKFAKTVFGPNKEYTVLQIMPLDDGNVLAELI